MPSSRFDQTCTCGNNVSNCPFWQTIERKFHSLHQYTSTTMYPSCPQLLRGTSANNFLVQMMSLAALYTSRRVWDISGSAARRFTDFYVEFIDTVKSYNNKAVFVNGQKSLTSVLSLKSILGKQAAINVIHLVRDPRGFYCSEHKDDPAIGLEMSTGHWNSYHSRVRKLVQSICDARYLAIRYEDLCEQPKATITRIFEFLDVEYQEVFHPPTIHHVIGHKSKDQFDGTLRQSMRWQSELSRAEQEQCLVLTQPISGELGYTM